MTDKPKVPKLGAQARRELRRSNSLRNQKYSIGGRLKERDKKITINLRLPPEKR